MVYQHIYYEIYQDISLVYIPNIIDILDVIDIQLIRIKLE